MTTLLPPLNDSYARDWAGLCMINECNHRGARTVLVKIGGVEREISVCDRHGSSMDR